MADPCPACPVAVWRLQSLDGAGRPSVRCRSLEAASNPLAPGRLLFPPGHDPCPLSPSPRALCSFLFLRYVNLILQSNKNLQGTKAFLQMPHLWSQAVHLAHDANKHPRPGQLVRCAQSVMSAGSLGRKVWRLMAVCVWVERKRAWFCHYVLDSSYVSGLASSCCKTAGSKIDPCFFQQTEGGVQTLRNGSVFVIRWDQGVGHARLANTSLLQAGPGGVETEHLV